MVNRQYFEAKFLVDADQLERMMGKKLPTAADKLQSKLTKTSFGQAFRQAGKDSEAFHRRLDETGKRLQSTGKNLSLAGAGVVAFGKVSIDAASDLAETQSKVGVVFGASAKSVLAFGKTAATSIGQSEQQAEEAAATFGNLFVSMKIGQRPAAQMSTTLVRLAGDLASFNNADPTETLEALRSGIVGETEPLRRFGVNLNDAGLRAEAMRLHLGKIGATLSPQQKALASYSLILQQTRTAQGDFARTSSGLANQQRITTAEFKDASAALGKEFLPIALDLVGVARRDIIPVVTKMADFFGRLPKPVREVGVAALVASGPLVFLTGKILSGIATLGKARAAWTSYRAVKLAQVAVDAELAAAEGGLAAATTATGAAAAGASVSVGRGGLTQSTGAFFRQGVAAIPVLGALAGGFLLSKQAVDDNVSTFDELRHALGFHVGALDDVREQQEAVTAKTNEYTLAITDQYPQLDTATAKQIVATAASKDAALKAAGAAQATKDYAKALEDYAKQLDQTKGAVAGAIPIFEGFHQSGRKASRQLRDEILKNLKDEVAGLSTWSVDVQRLLKRGTDPRLILELSQKGPQYLHAMAGASDKELRLTQSFFHQRMRATHDIAVQQLRLAGVEAPKAFAAGMGSQKPTVSKAAGLIAAAATNPLRLHNVAATIGRETGSGLAAGINSKTSRQRVSNAAAALSLLVISKTRAELGVRSPSTVMFGIGQQYIEGFVRGVLASMPRLEATAAGAGRGGAVALGKAMAAQRGWVGAQWNALYELWQHESGWNYRATNPTSGAYGIPQALPASKMAAAGPDWRTNAATQMRWGMDYIADRYVNPGNAWYWWNQRSPHWYGEGGIFTKPTVIGVGERGPEAVVPLRGRARSNEINVHIHGPVYDEQTLIRRIRTGVRDAQRREGVPAARQLD